MCIRDRLNGGMVPPGWLVIRPHGRSARSTLILPVPVSYTHLNYANMCLQSCSTQLTVNIKVNKETKIVYQIPSKLHHFKITFVRL